MGSSGWTSVYTKIDSYLDDGTSAGWTQKYDNLNGYGGNYGFIPIDSVGHAGLDISCDAADTLTFQDIYDSAIANGIPLNASIMLYDHDPLNHERRNTWFLNIRFLKVLAGCELDSSLEDLIFHMTRTYIYGNLNIGTYLSDYDATYDGDNILFTGHGVAFGALYFYSAGNAYIYDTTIRAEKDDYSVANSYGANFQFSAGSGSLWLVDVSVEGSSQTGTGFNNGFYISAVSSDNYLHRLQEKKNRWESMVTSATPLNVDGWTIYNTGQSGLWVHQKYYDDIERTLKNVHIYGQDGHGNIYASAAVSGYDKSYTNFLDSDFYDHDRIFWYLRGGTRLNSSYVKFSNTVKLHVSDPDGGNASGVSLTFTTNNGSVACDNITNSTGDAQCILTWEINREDPTATASAYQNPAYRTNYNPFTLTLSRNDALDYETPVTVEEPLSLSYSLVPTTLDGIKTLIFTDGGVTLTV